MWVEFYAELKQCSRCISGDKQPKGISDNQVLFPTEELKQNDADVFCCLLLICTQTSFVFSFFFYDSLYLWEYIELSLLWAETSIGVEPGVYTCTALATESLTETPMWHK